MPGAPLFPPPPPATPPRRPGGPAGAAAHARPSPRPALRSGRRKEADQRARCATPGGKVSSTDRRILTPPRPQRNLQGPAPARRGFLGDGGELLDVSATARMLGLSEKMLRARV